MEKYGNAVRDLHIIQALARSSSVASISVFNRPVTIHERLLRRKPLNLGHRSDPQFPRVNWVDVTDSSLLGPFSGRRWLASCYTRWQDHIRALRHPDATNILLDFTPLAGIDYDALGCDAVWYDAIDNFTKHNRFTLAETRLVREKYRYVSGRADFITAVSQGALDAFPSSSTRLVVPNGLPESPTSDFGSPISPMYDFGFMGFITDKFDIDLARRLSDLGYSIGVFGEAYDQRVADELKRMRGVCLRGPFDQRDASLILTQFRVGLIPYLRHKLHDESPLKLYQYLSSGRPVLSSVAYEIESPYVCVYEGMCQESLHQVSKRLLLASGSATAQEAMRASIAENAHWRRKIEDVLGALSEAIAGKRCAA